jgi:hypothetical protein
VSQPPPLGDILETVTEETLRDVYALTMAFLADDHDGQAVILSNCDPLEVTSASVYMTTAALTWVAHLSGHHDGAEVPFIAKALAGGLNIEIPGAGCADITGE